MKHLQRLCGTSAILPASLALTEELDDVEERPFTSGGFTDGYKATYKGQQVVAKVLKAAPVDDTGDVHKVGGLAYFAIAQSSYVTFSALCEGGRRMEVASTCERPAVRWGYLDTTIVFHGLDLDGERGYYEISQDYPKSESVQPRGYITSRIRQH